MPPADNVTRINPEQGQVLLPRRVVGKAKSQTVSTGQDKGQTFIRDNSISPNRSIDDYRASTDGSETLRDLFVNNSLAGTVMTTMVRMAQSGYRVQAFDTGTGVFSTPGVLAAEAQMSKWDTVWDYTKGFNNRRGVKLTLETLLLETLFDGGVGTELVLDNDRLPSRLQIFPLSTVIWKGNGKDGKFPSQRRAKPAPGQPPEVDLDFPNIWVAESMMPANRTYNTSFLVSSFKRLYHYETFIEEMQRTIRQSGQPRILVKLDYEKVRMSAPPQVQQDQDKLRTYMAQVQTDIENVVKDLSPEDALVFYDLAEVDSVQTTGEKADYTEMLQTLSGLTATALKANPAVLGLRLSGSQNTSSTESLLFLKTAAILHPPVEEIMSRALTLSVRLLGLNVYVKFQFLPIDLRPEHELAAFRSMMQANILEQLSLGFLTDDEAAVLLGTGSRPAGMPTLAGTGFYNNRVLEGAIPRANDNSDGRQLQPSTPSNGGGTQQNQTP